MKVFPLLITTGWLFILLRPPDGSFSELSPASIEHTTPEPSARFNSLRTPFNDYIWPTDASRTITSTFGEFRRTHFHAGIDISTHNQTGFRVFAARDGFVWRVSISPTGYGKVLYVRHDDGYTTAYAHLKTFNDTINRIVREEQRRLEQYPLDLVLDHSVLPVKKGELIGYTGTSGIGSPHLHFEIRDENFNPVNPQLFDQLAKDDNLPPAINRLAIIPLDSRSRVTGKRQASIATYFERQKDKSSRIPRTIQATGRVGFAVDVRDRIDGTYHRVGIHRLELFVDDSLIFAAQLDRLPADESKQILLFYNLPLMKKGKGRFQQLYTEVATSLPIYDRAAPLRGVLDAEELGAGNHSFTIVCKDIRGNATRLTGEIHLTPAPQQEHYLTTSSILGTNGKEELMTIQPGQRGWFSFDNDTLRVAYDVHAVFKPLNVSIEKNHEGEIPFYRFQPIDVLLNNGITVSWRTSLRERTLYALYVRDNHRFEMRPTAYDSTTRYVSATVTQTLGDVALLIDTIPPVITSLSFKIHQKRPTVQFHVHDDRSGIDAKTIKTYIDGMFVIPEIDDRLRVVSAGEQPLEKGTHQYTIVAQDRMGNRTTLTRSFTVH